MSQKWNYGVLLDKYWKYGKLTQIYISDYQKYSYWPSPCTR